MSATTRSEHSVTIDYDEIRAKAEALAEDAFWGSQDADSLTSGIVSLVTSEVERGVQDVRAALGAPSAVSLPAADTYSADTPEPPEHVTLLRDESHFAPYLHRVSDRWQWSTAADHLAGAYLDPTTWEQAACCARGVLTEIR
jgi:hypothetical protein